MSEEPAPKRKACTSVSALEATVARRTPHSAAAANKRPYWAGPPHSEEAARRSDGRREGEGLSLLEEFYSGGPAARSASHNLIELRCMMQTLALMVNAAMAAGLGTRPLTMQQPNSVLSGPIPPPPPPASPGASHSPSPGENRTHPGSEALLPPHPPFSTENPMLVHEIIHGLQSRPPMYK